VCSLDVEDHRPAGEPWPERFTAQTARVLDWFDERGVTATVFVVGSLAVAHPTLAKEIVARGHELAFHHWDHVQLTRQTPAEFREQVRRGRGELEDLVGDAVVGFRAPTASLVRRTAAAADILAEEGFAYSSSVIPARNPLFGFEGLPNHPFRWASGLAEFPMHVGGVGRHRVPYVCGTYLRILPWPVIGWLSRRQPWPQGAGVYFHPYDVDEDEPFHWLPDAGLMSPLVWVNRSRMFRRLDRLFADGGAGPYRDLLHLADAGPVVDAAALPA
jgi:polysaccharide deacetylase family protein (PEP-CTERM system associated)